MPSIRRPALLLSAAFLATAALGYDPALLRDFSVVTRESRLTVGAARVPLWGVALAQTDQVVLENVTLVQGSSTSTAKRIEFSGIASSRAEIEALFDRSSSEPLAARLGRINARQVSIPELVVEEQTGPFRQRSTYRNLTASDLRDGRIAGIVAEEVITEREAPTKARSTQKRLTLSGLAAADLARVYFEKAGPQPAPLSKIYDSFTVEDIQYQTGDGPVLRIARVNGRDVRMRPTEESWSGSTSLLAAMLEIDKPSEADNKRFLMTGADLLGAFEIGVLEMHGLDMQVKEKGELVRMRLSRAAYAGAAGQPADMRLEGFELSAKEGTARIGTLAFTGFSFQSTLEGIRGLKDRSLEDLDAATIRQLIPTIGTISLAGVDFDFLDDKSKDKGSKPERIRFSLKNYELTADKPINGIPTNIRIATQNLVMPVPQNSKDEGFKTLLGLGYKAIDWSDRAALSWNEADKEILIHEISGTAADMLNFKISGVVGNVTKDVFNADTAVATVAALGATAKRLEISLENTGFVERYLAQEAKKARKTPEALRQEYGSAAAIAVPALLGNSEQARTIGQALARFIARPTRVRIAARAKSAGGLTITDVMNVTKPAAILELLDVEAATDERI